MKSRLHTQPRMDSIESVFVDGMGEVAPAWASEERNRNLGQESTGEEEKLHRDLVRDAKERELSARKQFKVCSPIKGGALSKAIVDTRWVLTWEVVDGKKTGMARLAAKGCQGRI